MKVTFSKPALQGLKSQEKAYIAWDEGYAYDGSLGARVAPSGDVSIFVQYRVDGKQSKKTLHGLSAFLHSGASIAALRKEARDFVLDAQAKGMTTSEQAKAKTAEREQRKAQSMTIAELGEEYLANRAKDTANYRAYADGGRAARMAVRRAAAIWGDTPLTDLVVADAERLIDYVSSEHGPEAALQTRRLLQPMLRYPLKKGVKGVPAELFKGINTPRNPPRTTVLTPEERVRFFEAVRHFEQPQSNRTKRRADVSRDSADLLRLIYLTAARQGEWYKAQWGEIDPEEGTWHRPAEKRKKRNAHTMYLTPDTLAVLERIRERRVRERRPPRDEDYVFPSVQVGMFGEENSKPHRTSVWAAFQSILKIAGLEDKGLTIHDLRASRITSWNREQVRDFAEIAKDIGSSPEVLQRVYGREPDTVEERRQRMVVDGDTDLI